MFLAIVAGLGFGANQNVYTVVGVSIVLLIIVLRGIFGERNSHLLPNANLNVEIQWSAQSALNTTVILDKLATLSIHVSYLGLIVRSWQRISVQVGLQNKTRRRNW